MYHFKEGGGNKCEMAAESPTVFSNSPHTIHVLLPNLLKETLLLSISVPLIFSSIFSPSDSSSIKQSLFKRGRQKSQFKHYLKQALFKQASKRVDCRVSLMCPKLVAGITHSDLDKQRISIHFSLVH